MAAYRFKKSITKLLDRRPRDVSASKLLRLDLADLTAITNIQVEREPALQLDINGAPTTEVLRTFTGKPIFTDKSKEMVTLDVTFFVRTSEIQKLSAERGANIDLMSMGLVKPIDDQTVVTLATAMINIGSLTPANIRAQISADGSPDIANIQNDAQPPGENEDLLFPIRTSLKFSLDDVYEPIGRNFNDLIIDLRIVFGLFRSSPEPGVIGTPIEGSTFTLPYMIENDLRAYYTVKNPVKISAFASSLDQSLITIEKPSFSNASKVKILRRELRDGRQPGAFIEVRQIDFLRDTDTQIDESYTETFIDGDPNIDPDSPAVPVDNTVRYQYRAVPVGQRGAETIVFQDAFTDPITQANFEIGSNLRVLPDILSENGRLRQVGHSVHDSSLLDPGPLLVDNTSDIALVSYYNSQGAVTVEISNLQEAAAIDILRRDLTKYEDEFHPVPEISPLSKPYHVTAELESDARITYADTTTVEGHLYEYAVRSYTSNGLVQISQDKTQIQFRDNRLLVDDLNLTVSHSENLEENTAVLDISISAPNGITSLVNALLGTREPNSRQSPFFQDIIENRESLPPLFLPVVRRLNLVTGEERKFSSLTLDASKFEDLNPRAEGAELPSVFSFRFTDNDLQPGNSYRYEVLVNSRLPLSLLPSKFFVKDNIRRPYIFQPAKIQNPIFLQRGILPPTRADNEFLSAQDINVGPDRLLNRLTQEDPFEVGITATRQVVPATAPIIVPSLPEFNLVAPTARKTRQSALELEWSVSGDRSKLDYFQVVATDEYASPFHANQGCRRSQIVALVPAQSVASTFRIETKLERLKESDYRQFTPPPPNPAGVEAPIPPMSVLQNLVDTKRVAVSRAFDVIAVYHEGAVRKTISMRTETPTRVISPISSRISATSKVNIPPKYALSPNIALATQMSSEEISLEDIAGEIAAQQDRHRGKGNLGGGQTQVYDGRVNMGGDQEQAQHQRGYGILGNKNKAAMKDRRAQAQKGKVHGGNQGNRQVDNDAPPWWQQ